MVAQASQSVQDKKDLVQRLTSERALPKAHLSDRNNLREIDCLSWAGEREIDHYSHNRGRFKIRTATDYSANAIGAQPRHHTGLTL
jgi:hypothetical protein